jgi:UDP-3-O-[3-hydroxymyristoyl] glucosamine N-acyltransferase
VITTRPVRADGVTIGAEVVMGAEVVIGTEVVIGAEPSR